MTDLLAHRYDAGTPWLNLLATRGHAYGAESIERLTGLPALRAWLEHEHLTPRQDPVDGDVERVRALRETLRPLVLAALDGREPTGAQLAAVAPFLAVDEPVAVAVRAGRAAVAAPSTVDAALARLARHALEELPEAQLGACGDAACRMAYLDPGGRRRWCSPERCGVKARVRAHRARARTAGGPGAAGR